MAAHRNVLQFKIQLRDVESAIWRRIVVPAEYTFWDLHVAIQDAMGWLNCHLHLFRLDNPGDEPTLVGLPDPDPEPGDPIYHPDWRFPIAPYFAEPGDAAVYEYDFCEGWEHDVILEEVIPRVRGTRYPRCLEGERSCPPEDSGGPHGYPEFLRRARRAFSPGFDPSEFHRLSIKFDNPRRRWKRAFEDG